MPLPELVEISTNSDDLDRVQGYTSQWISDLQESVPIIDGNLLENIEISGSSENNFIEHKLGRDYRGYIVVKQDFTGSAVGDYTAATNTDASKFLVVRVSVVGTFNISLWVF